MKYMGSKRYMLQNGLGHLIRDNIASHSRFVDLFCGAGYVSRFVAQQYNVPVLASDLQKYATILTGAVINKTKPIDSDALSLRWIGRARTHLEKSLGYQKAKRYENKGLKTRKMVEEYRRLCEEDLSVGPVWGAYGGHYYSPTQALKIDYLIKYLPSSEPERTNALAALIDAASKCAAAPGHTAQPFQPTATAKEFLFQCWALDPFEQTQKALLEVTKIHAIKKGEARVCDAEKMAEGLRENDLVFIDPPYSGVQYSRFYHVLETIARGECGPVSGVGRYPDLKERPQSAYSNTSESEDALENLMKKIAGKGSSVIFTFPLKECSNGLSGKDVKDIVQKNFRVKEELVHGKFSTMGGNNREDNRPGRQKSKELLLYLTPK